MICNSNGSWQSRRRRPFTTKQTITFWAFSLINYLSLNSEYDDMYVFYIPVFKNHFVTKISLTHLKIISKNEDSPDNNKNLKYKFVWFPILNI